MPITGLNVSSAPVAWERSIGPCGTPTDAKLAVKFLRKSFHADPEAIARFRAEAATVATLDNPGIVKVHGTGRTPAGLYFMVMDFVDGADLWQVAANREIALSEAIDWSGAGLRRARTLACARRDSLRSQAG